MINENKKNLLLFGNQGFTLVELVITISLTIIFSAGVVYYSNGLRSQSALFKDQAQVLDEVYKAKNLSMTMRNEVDVCGYGVEFFKDSVSLIKVVRPNNGCSDFFPEDGKYNGSYGNKDNIETLNLSNGSSMSGNAVNNGVVFIPPDPLIIFKDGGSDGISISIKNKGGSMPAIKINQFGQINVE